MLYDLSSSYFEGTRCPLARLGHNRDGKKGKLQVNYGLTTDRRGCPVAISVFEGNTADSATLGVEVKKLRECFGIKKLVLVGDRGMISQRSIDEELSEVDGLAWITALKGERIRALVESGGLQCVFRSKANSDSGRSRTVIPGQAEHRFRACRTVSRPG